MKVYLTPAGKTALKTDHYLAVPRAVFNYDLVIVLTSTVYSSKLYERFRGENIIIIPLANPFAGTEDYMESVRKLVKQTILFARPPEEIVVNSSGGTEKMCGIVKDAGDILQTRYPVRRVFGFFDKDQGVTLFTEKPQFNPVKVMTEIYDEVEEIIKHQEESHVHLDLNSRLRGL